MNEETPQQNPVEVPTEDSQNSVIDQVPEPTPEKKSKKKRIIIASVVVALVAGTAAWYFLTKVSPDLVSKTQTTTQAPKVATTKEFKSADLDVALTYPVSWGDAKLAKGIVYSPGTGDYQQLTFSKKKDVDINFVVGGFSSPLDGCPDPLTVAKHDLSRTRSWTVGWSGSNLKQYALDYDALPATKYKVQLQSSVKSETSTGWTKVSTDGQVLVYKDINQAPITAIQEGMDSCQNITKAQAEESNTYYNFTHFALNFTNAKIIGVNAQYDTNKGEDTETVKQLIQILQSVK